jgi:hypothetical protein
MLELAQRAEELQARLMYHPPQPLKPGDFPGARLTVFEKLSSAFTLAECCNSLIASLLEDHAVLTLDDWVNLAKIGGNMARQITALEKVILGWVGMDEL